MCVVGFERPDLPLGHWSDRNYDSLWSFKRRIASRMSFPTTRQSPRKPLPLYRGGLNRGVWSIVTAPSPLVKLDQKPRLAGAAADWPVRCSDRTALFPFFTVPSLASDT